MKRTTLPMPVLAAMHPGNPHGLRYIEGDGGDQSGGGDGGDLDPTGDGGDGDDPDDQDPDPEGADQLGDAGKKALDRMKAERREARRKVRELEEQVARLTAQIEGRSEEHEREQAARREAEQRVYRRLVKAEIKAAAAGKLHDPADAYLHLDVDSFEVDDDGEVDADAIAAAIADLIEKKPYLAAQGGRFQGSADGGRRKGTGPSQLTEADLARMTPAEIDQARKDGRLNRLLGIRN